MPTPFPGMDPYLERPGLWVQVHTNLIVDIQRFLAPLLRPRYHVAVEQYTYLSVLPPDEQLVGIPDALVFAPDESENDVAVAVAPSVSVQALEGELPMPETLVPQRYLKIHDAANSDVITVIEILSPSNKNSREGRAQYERKRLKVLNSSTNLVEIDLTRIGKPFPMKVKGKSDYRIVLSRSTQRPKADIYLFGIRDRIPDFPIPLRTGETEPILPLNQILHELYDLGSYDLVANYHQVPEPPLPETDAKWVAQRLTEKILANLARTEESISSSD
jgi:hypothetical protein